MDVRLLGERRRRARLGRDMDGSRRRTLLGVSRTVKRGKTVAHEFMQIRETSPGQIAFIALPPGQSEASFLLVRLSGQEAVFENPQHDFPQRVIYRREGDLLTGRIEGSEGGETKGGRFPDEALPVIDHAPGSSFLSLLISFEIFRSCFSRSSLVIPP